MAFSGLLGRLIEPLFSVIDQAVEDKDQANQIKAQLQTQLISQQGELNRAARDIIVAEAQGESWLQRNWRPILMLFFAFVIGQYWFGYAPEYLQNNEVVINRVFDVIQFGLGGYVVGRSGEKIAREVAPVLAQGRKNG
jgi:hypothetical protein